MAAHLLADIGRGIDAHPADWVASLLGESPLDEPAVLINQLCNGALQVYNDKSS